MADNKYSKNFRLLSASDFSHLKVDSKIFKKPNLRVYFAKNSLNNSRIGISVSKRVGNAILRNRYKRICRELFRLSPMKQLNYDFLFVIQSYSKNEKTSIQLENDLKKSVLDYFNFMTNV